MKNILLIGGSYGIGNEIVKQLAANNTIYVASRTYQNLDPHVHHIPFDVTSDDLDEEKLPESLDGLVYCPGSINLKPFKMLTVDSFENDLKINFVSMIKVLKKVLPMMADKASIVLFSTVAVTVGMPFHTTVAAAKGAVEGFARSLAAEYAPKLRVNVVAPSLAQTPLAARLLNNDAKKEKMAARHPLKRVGTAKDIANTAVFLLSDSASWITGQVIGVDGGISTLHSN
ncbi:MAG: SDR family oxidoreductase [Bacteroidota bacterium]